MDKTTKKQLEAAGWSTGSAQDFRELTDAEAVFVDMKLALAADLRTRRLERHLNQTQVARLIGSSQSRIARPLTIPNRPVFISSSNVRSRSSTGTVAKSPVVKEKIESGAEDSP